MPNIRNSRFGLPNIEKSRFDLPYIETLRFGVPPIENSGFGNSRFSLPNIYLKLEIQDLACQMIETSIFLNLRFASQRLKI